MRSPYRSPRKPYRSPRSSTRKPARSPRMSQYGGDSTRKPARSPRMYQYGGDREYQVGDKVLITGRPSADYSVECNDRRSEDPYERFPHHIGHVGTIRSIRPARSDEDGLPLYTLYEVYPDGGPWSDVFPVEHIEPA